MRLHSPFSPTASRGRVRPWRLRLAPASAACSGHSMSLQRLAKCGHSVAPERVDGVTFDGQHFWFASGDKLNAFDPGSGKVLRSIDVAAHAGTAFDGKHLFQLAEDRIQKIDPKTGRVLAAIPAPGGGRDSGL